MASSQKFYPTAEELTTINSTVRCPEDGCSSIFMSESNLNLHLLKTHKKENLMISTPNVVREYYCPELSCAYNNTKSFKALKFLKQHYLKVHSPKVYGCDTCDMKFSTQSAKNSHLEYCNAKFTCSECSSSYSTYESLLTHGRRKKHTILDKTAFKTVSIPKTTTKSSSITNLNQVAKKNIILLPKASTSLQLVNCNDISIATYEKGSQTDIWTEKSRLLKKMSKPINNSQETQTLINKQHLTAETQTIGDYFTKKSSTYTLNEEDLHRNSIKTQTKQVDFTTKSCNTSFNLSDFNFANDNKERNHTETQTTSEVPPELLYSTPQSTHYPMNTEKGELKLFEFKHSSSQTNFNEDMDMFEFENYFNCNMETQTDFMSMLNTDYCSNMHTQTCDNLLLNELGSINSHTQTDFMSMLNTDDYLNMYTQTCDNLLLNELGFINSHTQTVFDDILVLKSVESQTMMPAQPHSKALNCRDMAHMETQTDIESQQLLEEINA